MNTKQVIVIRRDLKMRRGKEIAQGSHASMAFLTRGLMSFVEEERNFFSRFWLLFRMLFGSYWHICSALGITKAQWEWMNNSYAKVCLQVESEEELLKIQMQAIAIGVECHMITDSGRTEFNGVPTKTCLALGPDESEKIDRITSHLKLY